MRISKWTSYAILQIGWVACGDPAPRPSGPPGAALPGRFAQFGSVTGPIPLVPGVRRAEEVNARRRLVMLVLANSYTHAVKRYAIDIASSQMPMSQGSYVPLLSGGGIAFVSHIGTVAGASPATVRPLNSTGANDIIIGQLFLDNFRWTYTINTSFVIIDIVLVASGVSVGVGRAYIIQSAAAAVNPSWSGGATLSTGRAGVATFK